MVFLSLTVFNKSKGAKLTYTIAPVATVQRKQLYQYIYIVTIEHVHEIRDVTLLGTSVGWATRSGWLPDSTVGNNWIACGG